MAGETRVLLRHFCATGSELDRQNSAYRFDGDLHGAGAEKTQQEPGKFAGGALGEKLQTLAGADFNPDFFAVPGIVHANGVVSRAYVESCRIAEHQFAMIFAVQKNLDLAGLRVARRIANDSDLRAR